MTKIEQNLGVIISYFAIVLLQFFITFSIGFENEMILLVALGTITTSTFLLCLIVFKILRKSNKSSEIDYLNTCTQRNILGMFMIFYGLPKIFGTFCDYLLFALDSKLANISDFELAWF